MATAALKLSKERRVQLLLDARNLLLKNCQLLFARFQNKTVEQLNRFSPNVFAELDYAEPDPLTSQWGEKTSQIRKTFLAEIASNYALFARGKLRERRHWEVENDRPGLMDTDNLEQDLALANMVSKTLNRNQEALYGLERRFAVLANGMPLDEASSPVAPAVFASALQRALSEVSAGASDKLLVYKIFDREFMAALPFLFTSLNDWLEGQGILANLMNPAAEPLESEVDTQAVAALSAIQQQLAQHYQLLPADKDACFTVGELLHVLNGIQTANHGLLESNSLQPDADAIRKQLAHHLGFGSIDYVYSNLLERDHMVSLELVHRLFETLAADQTIAGPARELIGFLHVPWMKLALLHPRLLEEPSQPANILLNELCLAAQRWVDVLDHGQSSVLQEIRQVVRRLLGEFDKDTRLVTELAFQFKSYARAWRRRIDMAEKRAIQAAKGEDKLLETRHDVQQMLQSRVAGYELHSHIETLLFDPWLNFMAFTRLRHGLDSEQWQQACSAVDSIIKISWPKADWAELREIRELRDELIPYLRTGCQRVGYEPLKTEQLLVHLLQYPGEQAMAATSAPDQTTPPPVLDPTLGAERGLGSAELDEINALAMGCWLEITNQSKFGKKNLKLAWRNPATMNYMFVNRLGRRELFINGRELAELAQKGEIHSLPEPEQTPFLERGIKYLLAELPSAAEE